MQITVKRQRVIEETLDVDDRIYEENSDACKIANVLLDGGMKRIIDRHLYSDNEGCVDSAVRSINDAFKKADEILAIMRRET